MTTSVREGDCVTEGKGVREKQDTEKEKEEARLDAIVEGASRLPLELQQCILAAIKGMLLAHEQERKRLQQQQPMEEKDMMGERTALYTRHSGTSRYGA